MSLEAELKANTAALLALTAAYLGQTPAAGKPAAPQAPAAPKAPTTSIDYDRDVKAHVVALGKAPGKGRDAVLAVIGAFKTKAGAVAANALEVDPKDWPELSKQLQAKLAEAAPLA